MPHFAARSRRISRAETDRRVRLAAYAAGVRMPGATM